MIRRSLGLLLVLVFLLAFEPGQSNLLQQVALPCVAALGAWLVVGHPAAVLLAMAGLAGIHADPGAGDLVRARLYPAVAAVAGIAAAAIFAGRFVERVRSTRDARRQARAERRVDEPRSYERPSGHV